MANNLLTPANLHKNIIQVVKKFVECQDELVFDYFSDDKSKLALKNKERHFCKDEDKNFFLCRVKNVHGLYLHIDISYKIPETKASLSENTFRFEGISIQFWHGTGKAFCRADWEEKKDKLEHPQPHWHWGEESDNSDNNIHSGDEYFSVNQTVELGGGFFQEVGIMSNEAIVEKLPDISFEKLHYAIGAKWTERDVSVEPFSETKLLTWIKNVIPNVIDEYSYQVNKKRFTTCRNW